LREAPFAVELSTVEGRLVGSLDSGTTHPTSFGLWYIDEHFTLHRLFTYHNSGMTIADHAEEIYRKIESFPWTQGVFPDKIVADPSMWTKVKLNENMVRAPIVEYIEIFRKYQRHTVFEKANNVKGNGCQLMRMVFKGVDGYPKMFYFDLYNQSYEEGIASVMTDKNDTEVYAKAEGDDGADESRYGIVAGYSMVAALKGHKKAEVPKTRLEKLLSGELGHRTPKAVDCYEV